MRELRQRVVTLFSLSSRLLRMVWEANPRYAFLALLLTIATGAVPPAQIWISKLILDQIVASVGQAAGLAAVDWRAVLLPLGWIFIVWSVGALCQAAAGHMMMLVGFNTSNHTEHLILSKASQLDLAFYDTPVFYDQLNNALKENHRAHNFAYMLLQLISTSLSLAAMLGLLWRLHPLAVLVLILTTAPQTLVVGYYTKRHYHLHTSRASAWRMRQYLSGLLSSREAVKEQRLFSLDKTIFDRFQRHSQLLHEDNKRERFDLGRADFFLGLWSMLGTALLWGYAVFQAVLARITVGDVALVFQTAEQGRTMMRGLFSGSARFYEDTLYARNLFTFLDLGADSVEGALVPGPLPPRKVPSPIAQGIEFRGVSFRYPHAEGYVLRDLSFTLHPGETVALVGANGAGKTTLIKLLTRLYDPTEGAILVDGRDLREYDLEAWRRQIGVIFQDFVKYDFSVRENIGFGQVEHAGDRERVALAAEKGGARPVIDKLPAGFDTILGKTFDQGVDLSGGEWQKLALSRAFMREAQILILDEPTAALDALAEYEVYNRFAALTAGKLTLFISHRFSTVRMAHHILVLKNGHLIEEGGHEDLLALGGKYAQMFTAQAERYR